MIVCIVRKVDTPVKAGELKSNQKSGAQGTKSSHSPAPFRVIRVIAASD